MIARLRLRLRTLLGEEDILLPAGPGLLALQTCHIPIETPGRGYRIVRKGDTLTIDRFYPWWEDLFLDGELQPQATAARYVRAFATRYVGLHFRIDFPFQRGLDYRLRTDLGSIHTEPMLPATVEVQGGTALLCVLAFLALVFPACLTVATLAVASEALPQAWPDLSQALWQSAVLLLGWAAMLSLNALLVVALVAFIRRGRERGRDGKRALLHFADVLAAASKAPA